MLKNKIKPLMGYEIDATVYFNSHLLERCKEDGAIPGKIIEGSFLGLFFNNIQSYEKDLRPKDKFSHDALIDKIPGEIKSLCKSGCYFGPSSHKGKGRVEDENERILYVKENGNFVVTDFRKLPLIRLVMIPSATIINDGIKEVKLSEADSFIKKYSNNKWKRVYY